jgi:hypothetical protein
MSVFSINKKRPPQILCEFCGEPEHKMPLACPRIKRIVYSEDGDVTVSFTETPFVIIPTNKAPD